MPVELKQKVADILELEPNLMPSEVAEKLVQKESDVVAALPDAMVCLLPLEQMDMLFSELPEWGVFTTIVHSHGSIFEIKDVFPKGSYGRGYYNLMDKNSALHGHLKLDAVTQIALVSKPFRGSESYSFQFFSDEGGCIFKIYLGRDKKRQLIPEQVDKFKSLIALNK